MQCQQSSLRCACLLGPTICTKILNECILNFNITKIELMHSVGDHARVQCQLPGVMIYHRGVSLSEQHTGLLICHCTKRDLSLTSRYVDKSSPER